MAKVLDHEAFVGLKIIEDSIFKDVIFLDTIKGSVLGSQSKVQADGADPFIGHAKMLNKQVKYHPSIIVSKRATVFLWAQNWRSAVGLASAMATLPLELGGFDFCLGQQITTSSEWYKDKHPYYETILNLDVREFFKYSLFLRGVYISNPKGIPWENNIDVISAIATDCKFYDEKSLIDRIPAKLKEGSFRKILRYIEDEFDMISISFLSSFLARQEAFLKLWEGKEQTQFVTDPCKRARERANKAWAVIKTDLPPTPEEHLEHKTIKGLAKAFKLKTEGLWVSRTDPAIENVFNCMPILSYPERSSLKRKRKKGANPDEDLSDFGYDN